MPKDPPSHPGSKSHRHLPYPSSFSTQDGRIRVPRSRPISRNSPNAFPPSLSRTLTGRIQRTPPYPEPIGWLPPPPQHPLVTSRLQQPIQNAMAQARPNIHGPMPEQPKLYIPYTYPNIQDLPPPASAAAGSQQLTQNMIGQLWVNRHAPSVEPPPFYNSDHSQLAPSSVVQSSPPNLYPLSSLLPTLPLQALSRTDPLESNITIDPNLLSLLPPPPMMSNVVHRPSWDQVPIEDVPQLGSLPPPPSDAVAPIDFASQPFTSQRLAENRVQKSIGEVAGSIMPNSPRRPPTIVQPPYPPPSSITPLRKIVESQSFLNDLEFSSQTRHAHSDSSDHRGPANYSAAGIPSDLSGIPGHHGDRAPPPQISAPVYMDHPANRPPSRSRYASAEVDAVPRRRPRDTDATRSKRSFFHAAHNIQMGDLNLHCVDADHVTVHSENKPIDGWKLLLEHTAPNALHNSRTRYDAPKCDQDTRVEVTNELTTFLEDRDGPQRLLCMTGAAGSGKSALQQTVAEKCGGKGTLGSSFFFSAADSSRNTVGPVIPTIAYQLGRETPRVQMLIKTAVEKDPLVFSQSLKDQITSLIVKPFERLGDEGLDLSTLPCAILIDGLDECRGEDSQAELLTAIAECLLVEHLPFRIFIASRPEWAIRTALEPGGYLHTVAYHIRLSDNYDASGDMRRYLTRRFDALSSRTGNPRWYTPSDINTLVSAASGQFVYVAVVFAYISERRGSPVERLKIVLTWTPRQGGKTRPFEALDTLYRHILSTAKDAYEALDTNSERDFLLLLCTYHANMLSSDARFDASSPRNPLRYSFPLDSLTILLGLGAGAEEIFFSDLRSLFALEGSRGLRVYHKSFSDFLEGESRAGALFVAHSRIRTHLAMRCMRTIIEYPSSLDCCVDTLPDLRDVPQYLVHAINALPLFLYYGAVTKGIVGVDFDSEITNFGRKGGWRKVDWFLPVGIVKDIVQWDRDVRNLISHLTPDTAAPVRELAAKLKQFYPGIVLFRWQR